MYMVILLQGVRMMVGEINGSFKGWQDRFIPNAIPAVDVAALLPFSPNAATLGFVFCTFGTIFPWASCCSSIALLWYWFCSALLFRRSIGVLANRMGISFRYYLYFPVRDYSDFRYGMGHSFNRAGKEGVGWTGIFDWATLWPAICELLKFIASTFHLGLIPFN